MEKSPPDILEEAAATFRERNELYGNNWKDVGKTLSTLFPDGLTLTTEDEWARFAIFMHQINKLTRTAQMFKRGGHIDSSHDMIVYASMMESLERGSKP